MYTEILHINISIMYKHICIHVHLCIIFSSALIKYMPHYVTRMMHASYIISTHCTYVYIHMYMNICIYIYRCIYMYAAHTHTPTHPHLLRTIFANSDVECILLARNTPITPDRNGSVK